MFFLKKKRETARELWTWRAENLVSPLWAMFSLRFSSSGSNFGLKRRRREKKTTTKPLLNEKKEVFWKSRQTAWTVLQEWGMWCSIRGNHLITFDTDCISPLKLLQNHTWSEMLHSENNCTGIYYWNFTGGSLLENISVTRMRLVMLHELQKQERNSHKCTLHSL